MKVSRDNNRSATKVGSLDRVGASGISEVGRKSGSLGKMGVSGKSGDQ